MASFFARILETRTVKAATGPSGLPQPEHRSRDPLVRRALQVLRRIRRHHDGAVRDRSRLLAQRLRHDRQGRRPRRDPDRRLRRRRGRDALRPRDLPVDRRRPADGVEPRVHLAGAGRHQSLGADRRDHRGELHRRDRHRDLRRLSLGAVPEPAAHRDAIRAADGAGRGRPHLSLRAAPALSPRRPAGRCSSCSASLLAIPSLLLLAWLQQRGHFAALKPASVVRGDD